MNQKYREFTKTTAVYPPEQALEYLGLGIASEAGEVAGKIKKWIRDGEIREKEIISEVGDVIWYCDRIADEMGYTLDEIIEFNIHKLQSRKDRDKLKGSGDDR